MLVATIGSEAVLRHWQEAFAACRTLNQCRNTEQYDELMTRRAQAQFWGAVAVLCVYGDGSVRGVAGEFNPSLDNRAMQYRDLERSIADACSVLPPWPDTTELPADAWQRFFEIVDALRHDDDRTAELICEELAFDDTHNVMWWLSRAMTYEALNFLPLGAQV